MQSFSNSKAHVTLSQLTKSGLGVILLESNGGTYVNYNKIHCGMCDSIMYSVQNMKDESILAAYRYCVPCKILVKFEKLSVIRCELK